MPIASLNPQQWELTGHFMAYGITWQVRNIHSDAQSALRIRFIRYRKLTKTDALKSLADALAEAQVDWLKPIGDDFSNWIVDLDAIKRSLPSINSATDLSGRAIVRPVHETTSDVHVIAKKAPSVRYKTYIRFNYPLNTEDENMNVPPELRQYIDDFLLDHPDPKKTAFIMMRFEDSDLHKAALKAVRAECSKYGIKAVRADDKLYSGEKWSNIRTYMHGCGFGIALFERISQDDFNPNVSLEVGYMMGMGKRVLLLKDKTLPSLQGDLHGSLYVAFNPQDAKKGIAENVGKWLSDFKLIYNSLDSSPDSSVRKDEGLDAVAIDIPLKSVVTAYLSDGKYYITIGMLNSGISAFRFLAMDVSFPDSIVGLNKEGMFDIREESPKNISGIIWRSVHFTGSPETILHPSKSVNVARARFQIDSAFALRFRVKVYSDQFSGQSAEFWIGTDQLVASIDNESSRSVCFEQSSRIEGDQYRFERCRSI